MDNDNAIRRRPLHDPIKVHARDCKLWTAEEAAATLANVMKVRCKCRNCRGQTWVSRRTAAKHLKSIGRDPRLRANVEVSFPLFYILTLLYSGMHDPFLTWLWITMFSMSSWGLSSQGLMSAYPSIGGFGVLYVCALIWFDMGCEGGNTERFF
jgi:hypothetical protein